MERVKFMIQAMFAFVGGAAAHFLGGCDAMLKALLLLIAIDYITGMLVALVFKKSRKTASGGASSIIGFKGIVKKMCEIAIVGVAVCLDDVMKSDYIRSLAIMFFIANEGLSILENAGLMGVKYPKKLKQMLDVLKKDGDDNGE